jgi:hypothetical protein
MTLEDILQKHFGCSSPFLKKKRIAGYWSDGDPKYEYMTKAGGKAYGKLISLLDDLELVVGHPFDADRFTQTLDEIVDLEE